VAWSLLFIFMLYFTAPAYAAFAKLEVYQEVIGRAIADLPQWIYSYGKVGLINVCGAQAVDPAAVAAACQKIANHAGILRFGDFAIQADAIVISTPEIAGLPYVVSGLVAAGGLAAALSTADGLLLAIANALSHDVYYKMIDKNAPTARRLTIARILLVGVAVLAAYTASFRPADIVAMVAWAFSLAAAGIFPALVMGIWWKRTSTVAALTGMAIGFGLCLYYLVGTRYYAGSFYETWSFLSSATSAQAAKYAELKAAWLAAPDNAAAWKAYDTFAQGIANWFGVKNISAALFSLPLGFLIIWAVSLVTPGPSVEMRAFIDEIRRPRGQAIFQEKTR
jgi:cation/acetate symporter